MLNLILLIISAIIIPIIFYAGMKTYNIPRDNKKVFKGIALSLLFIGLFRFFYSASLYDQGFLPAKQLTLSYLSILIVVALFAAYHNGKLGAISEKIVFVSALVPVVFPIFNESVFLNPDDIYMVTTALYFIQVGLITTLTMLYLANMKITLNLKEILISLVLFVLYVGVAIGLNFGWKLEIPFDLNFFLGYGLSLVSILIMYGLGFLLNRCPYRLRKVRAKETGN